MSLINGGVPTELLYSNATAATQLSAFTSEANLQQTYSPVQLPMIALAPSQSATGFSLRVKASGQLGTTGSPTFQWFLRLLPQSSGVVPSWSAGGILLGSTAAATAGATVTLAYWFLDADITIRSISTGAASTVVTTGEVRSAAGLASPFATSIPASNTSPAVATLDNSQTYYLFLSAACGTNNALNLINLQLLKVWGEN